MWGSVCPCLSLPFCRPLLSIPQPLNPTPLKSPTKIQTKTVRKTKDTQREGRVTKRKREKSHYSFIVPWPSLSVSRFCPSPPLSLFARPRLPLSCAAAPYSVAFISSCTAIVCFATSPSAALQAPSAQQIVFSASASTHVSYPSFPSLFISLGPLSFLAGCPASF